MTGRVIKGISSNYFVEVEGKEVKCSARGRLKLDGEIFVGDYVELEECRNNYVISKVLPRKNSLIRPYVANIDIAIIVIAPSPKPDLFLVDKIIINALKNLIEPIIVVNKTDLVESGFLEEICFDYKGVAEVYTCSALSGDGVEKLLELTSGKVACLAGQSAVGKSSILNAILGEQRFLTGALSKKIERGCHTTRQSELIRIGNSLVIDTCGFSMLELEPDFNPADLSKYYDDYFEYSSKCRFRGCTHTTEPDCAVKKAVTEGLLAKGRYERYVELLNSLNEKWRKRYD
jgi:ribosome biogenesis GTPase